MMQLPFALNFRRENLPERILPRLSGIADKSSTLPGVGK
jgi:hypothetical protein